VLRRAYLESAVALARRRGLATHLDGARIFNAAVKLGLPVAELCRGFDSVSVCLSKGLGAPAGTMLVGTAPVIERARRARKILGGAMRQAGILAAGGLYALEHHVERLADDHANAERLAAGLADIRGLEVELPQTNMVFVRVPADRTAALQADLKASGVLALIGARTRLVTHLDVSAPQIDDAVAAFRAFFAR
jgi:threonine aldolase